MPVGLLAAAEDDEAGRRGQRALLHERERGQRRAEGGQGAGVQEARGLAVWGEERDGAGGADGGCVGGGLGGGGGGGRGEGYDCGVVLVVFVCLFSRRKEKGDGLRGEG